MISDLPENFQLFNEESSKKLVIVVEIEGVDLITMAPVLEIPKYGDPNLFYGQLNLVYGGLVRKQGTRDILSLEGSSMNLQQKIEPEQGRASVSTLSLGFLDTDGYMSQVITPGLIIPDILNRQVRMWIGYREIAFPEDYVIYYRGRVTSVKTPPGMVELQLSDPNTIRRQKVFKPGKTALNGSIDDTTTTINVLDNADFHQQILGPNGLYDEGVKTYLKIDDEWIEYTTAGFGDNVFTSVVRGARGTDAVAHDAGVDVDNAVELTQHAIDLSLKTMLSGWNGPWKKDVPVFSLVDTLDGTLLLQSRAIILPPKVNAVRDFGLVEQDYITIRGSAIGGNNIQVRAVSFGDLLTEKNRIIYIDTDLTVEYPTAAVLDFRSQFDTLPVTCGVKMPQYEVDVAGLLELKDTWFGSDEYTLQFLLTAEETLKSFLESEVYFAISAFSLTRRGQVSAGVTKPPISGEDLVYLDNNVVLNPANIKPDRGFNNRKFFNEIDIQYDLDDAGNYRKFKAILDADSSRVIQKVEILPVTSRGARSENGFTGVLDRIANNFLSVYKNAATLIPVEVNWATIMKIEAGDVVALKDEGNLKIYNIATGERNIGTKLFTVIDRTTDIRGSKGSVQLMSGVKADISDRYAVFSPSSITVSGDQTKLKIKDSFGKRHPGNEMVKWRQFVGFDIQLHTENSLGQWTGRWLTKITGISTADPYVMFINGTTDLAGAPSVPPSYVDLIIDVPDYPDTDQKLDQSIYKAQFAYRGLQVAVASGASETEFDLVDASRAFPGCRIYIHKEDWSVNSGERTVDTVVGNTVTVTKPLGFVPDNTFLADGMGFPDRQGCYRYY